MKKILIFLLLPIYVNAQVPSSGGYLLTNSNGSVSIGTQVNTAPLTVTNFTTAFPTPQTGTIVHLISSGITINPRISMDAYNGTNVNGSIFQGRRAGGSAGTPTAALADYTLAGFAGDGYGVDSFHNISVGAFVIKSEGTMTNTSAPTYLSLMTTPSGSTTIAERMRIKSTGGLRFNSYGSGTFAGTPVYSLQVDASGNVIEGGMGGSASWGSITGTLSSQSDLQTALNAKLNISDTASMLSAYQTAIAGKQASGSYAVTTNNLSDLSNAGTARTNLGLGTLATQSGTFSGTSSGTNTGDQTTVSGNAGTATALQTARKVNGVSFDATADITTDNDLVVYAVLGSPIKYSGQLSGLGGSTADDYIGLSIKGDTSLISWNTIVGCGYNGIEFNGFNSTVAYNFVDTVCNIKDDGGGVYSWNDATSPPTYTNRSVNMNIVLHALGADAGTDSPGSLLAYGIYLDDNTMGVTLDSNTCAYSGESGIYLHNAHEITLTYNNLYGNRVAMTMTQDGIPTAVSPLANINYNHNIFYAELATDEVVEMSNRTTATVVFGTYNNNVYTRPLDEATGTNLGPMVACYGAGAQSCTIFPWGSYSLATWKTLVSTQDAASTTATTTITTSANEQLIYNSSTTTATTVELGAYKWIDVYGTVYNCYVTLQPLQSLTLIKSTASACTLPFTKHIGLFRH